MSLLDLSRWQFAITVMFHMTFPAITVGLSVLLCVLYGMTLTAWATVLFTAMLVVSHRLRRSPGEP